MESGKELASDLKELWHLGNETLPEIGRRWADANGELSGHAADTGTFSRSTYVAYPYGGGSNSTSVGRVYPYFDALRDALQNVMAESANNMYDAAEAILIIMNNYANSDTVAGQDLTSAGLGDLTPDTLRRSRPSVTKSQ